MWDRLVRAWRQGASPWRGLRDGPKADPQGRTGVPGLWVAGDLSGAPLLKTALRDGWDVGTRVAEAVRRHTGPADVDVVVIGAGPAGCAAARALQLEGRSVRVFERDRPFRTLEAFPAGKMIYAEPRGVPTQPPLWFEDAPKEELVTRWRQALASWQLDVQEGTTVTDLSTQDGRHRVTTVGDDGVPHTTVARQVILAIGRRGTPRRLGVPGEEQAHVGHQLTKARDHAGQRVVVVGGGDSAAEAACALVAHAAHVTLIHRSQRLDRPRSRTREALEEAEARGQLTLRLGAEVTSIGPTCVTLRDDPDPLPADAVLVLVGADPPMPWLRRFGVKARSDVPWSEVGWMAAFAAAVWCFYVLKYHKPWFPFGPGSFEGVHAALRVPVPWYPTADGSLRVLDAGFWGTVLYSLAIAGFGVAAIRRYRSPVQTRRYLSLIGFQWVFLFGVPELLAPMVTTAASQLYTLSVPWPLSIESLAKTPDTPAALLWLALGAGVTFVAVPVYVRRYNEQFCSYLCGCGGLAETVGDMWRWRAPRGDLAQRAEIGGRMLFLLAVPVTLLILADAWQLVGWRSYLDQTVTLSGQTAQLQAQDVPEEEGNLRIAEVQVDRGILTLTIEKFDWDGVWRRNGWTSGVRVGDRTVYPTKTSEGVYTLDTSALPAGVPLQVQASTSALSHARTFARGWYALMVDFWLASFLGVALYPVLGNRIWCRFFCPLRAYMQWIAARWGRLAIVADGRCISCGDCTTACQMGIDVQGYADKQLVLDNASSSCIQCGICVQVCPMDVLTLVDKPTSGVTGGVGGLAGPRWGG